MRLWERICEGSTIIHEIWERILKSDYSQDFGRGFMRLWERIHEDSCKTLGEDL